MENFNSKFEFLDSEESENYFALCDYQLKSGKHIQNYPHEIRFYDYLDTYFSELKYYYEKLFGITLKYGQYGNEKYYFLDFDSETKGKLGGNKSDKISARHTLLGLLLLKIYRLDNYFGRADISIEELKESLKNESNDYRDDVYRLFAKVSSKNNASEPDENNIDLWIENSINKFNDLGWVLIDVEDKNRFTIMPSLNRLFEMYIEEIKNIDSITDTSKNPLS